MGSTGLGGTLTCGATVGIATGVGARSGSGSVLSTGDGWGVGDVGSSVAGLWKSWEMRLNRPGLLMFILKYWAEVILGKARAPSGRGLVQLGYLFGQSDVAQALKQKVVGQNIWEFCATFAAAGQARQ